MNSKKVLKEMLDLITYYSYWVDANDYYKEVLQDLDKLEKLEKVIEILKENFEIALHYDDEFPTPMISVDGSYSYINKQEYNLLKEVLKNEK